MQTAEKITEPTAFIAQSKGELPPYWRPHPPPAQIVHTSSLRPEVQKSENQDLQTKEVFLSLRCQTRVYNHELPQCTQTIYTVCKCIKALFTFVAVYIWTFFFHMLPFKLLYSVLFIYLILGFNIVWLSMDTKKEFLCPPQCIWQWYNI